MKIPSLLKLIISLVFPLSVGLVAGQFTASSVNGWYNTLRRPDFAPPNWLFAPVWTMLYVLMGISLFMVWKLKPSPERSRAITLFIIQLALNFAWSFLFFYLQSPGWALVDIILLWMAILTTLVYFHRLKPWAAYLNIPYLLWVSFATVLNAAFYFLNN